MKIFALLCIIVASVTPQRTPTSHFQIRDFQNQNDNQQDSRFGNDGRAIHQNSPASNQNTFVSSQAQQSTSQGSGFRPSSRAGSRFQTSSRGQEAISQQQRIQSTSQNRFQSANQQQSSPQRTQSQERPASVQRTQSQQRPDSVQRTQSQQRGTFSQTQSQQRGTFSQNQNQQIPISSQSQGKQRPSSVQRTQTQQRPSSAVQRTQSQQRPTSLQGQSQQRPTSSQGQSQQRPVSQTQSQQRPTSSQTQSQQRPTSSQRQSSSSSQGNSAKSEDSSSNAGHLLSLPDPESCKNRPKQWQFNGKNYYFSWDQGDIDPVTKENRKVDWLIARNSCRKMCMDSIGIETEAENNMVIKFMGDRKLSYIWTSGRLCDFTGCSQRKDLHPVNVFGWFWSDTNTKTAPTNSTPPGWVKQPWSTTGHTGVPQPDNAEFAINRTPESCLAVLNDIYKDGIVWHDIACYHKKPYICEDSKLLLDYVKATNKGIVL